MLNPFTVAKQILNDLFVKYYLLLLNITKQASKKFTTLQVLYSLFVWREFGDTF